MMRESNPKTTYLKEYKPPNYLVEAVDLHFTLDEENTKVVSRLNMVKNPKADTGASELILLGEELVLDGLSIDGRQLGADEYSLDRESLTIASPAGDDHFIVELHTRTNPKANTALEGLYLSTGMFCTQCEAEGFRKISYFPDRPDIMARFTTTIMADKDQYPVLLSNGNPVEHGDMDNNLHWVKWQDPYKKPCYLFALVAGKLECLEDRFTTTCGSEVDLKIYVEKHDLDKCEHAMDSLKKAMRWDEQVYGRIYDLDLYMIVAVSHFNMGAMENKGLNIFNSKYVLARSDTATDTDYEQIQGVIAHEYFHNWTGNRITCRDWFQLSLKEGLTVFRDQEFTADQTSRGVKRINDVNMLRTRQFAEDAGPMAHPVRPDSYMEINNFYTLTVYEKGAEVVRMIHTLLGAEGFRKGMDLYFQRHDGQAVTTDDFVKAMEDANGIDLAQFRRWYTQAGTPEIRVGVSYDVRTERLTIDLKQSCAKTPGQPQKLPFHIPVAIGFIGKGGALIPIQMEGEDKDSTQAVLELTETQQQFTFVNLKDEPIVSVLKGFSAPVNLVFERQPKALAYLLAYDPDPFNRWEAGQQLASRIILNLIAAPESLDENTAISHYLIESFKEVLTNHSDDLSFLSLLLSLPSEAYLGEQMEIIDVDAIHTTRERVRTILADALNDQFLALYQQYHRTETGNFNIEAVGRRKIKNTCLSYLMALQSQHSYRLSEQQYTTATNMTDQIAALATIVDSQHPAKNQCLEQFYQHWQNESLVIDKWFSIQAMASLPNTFEKVKQLREHQAFDIKTPNRVRSLISAFSQNNPLNFHRENGEGYRFLGDHITLLDKINPQIASRMVEPFTHWRRHNETRQQLMKTQLQRIVNNEGISKDVFEIASKSLAV